MSWLEFATDNRVPYRRGSGGKWIEVHCPICGDSDRSMHMGLRLADTFWGCLRDSEHRGMNPTKLIRLLLNCSWDEASVATRQYFPHTNTYHEYVKDKSVEPMSIPDTFMPFGDAHKDMQEQFARYLQQRNLDPSYAISRFDLRWSIAGKTAYRIIIPVVLKTRWYTWTARSIAKTEPLRYLANASIAPGKFLFDCDSLNGSSTLVICEGPFDAMSVTNAFIPGIHATALFGKSISDEQLTALINLSEKYDKLILAYDRTAYSDALKAADSLSLYIPNILVRSSENKDFSATPPVQLKEELKRYVA